MAGPHGRLPQHGVIMTTNVGSAHLLKLTKDNRDQIQKP
jgi:hypothetical protein